MRAIPLLKSKYFFGQTPHPFPILCYSYMIPDLWHGFMKSAAVLQDPPVKMSYPGGAITCNNSIGTTGYSLVIPSCSKVLRRTRSLKDLHHKLFVTVFLSSYGPKLVSSPSIVQYMGGPVDDLDDIKRCI